MFVNSKSEIPLVAVRNIVIFPNIIFPLFIGRELSVNAVNEAVQEKTKILIVTQQNSATEIIKPDNLYTVGVLANVVHVSKINDTEMKVIIDATSRVRVTEMYFKDSIAYASYEEMPDAEYDASDPEILALQKLITKTIAEYSSSLSKTHQETLANVPQIDNLSIFADIVASSVPASISEKQKILEITNFKDKLRLIYKLYLREYEVLSYENNIQTKVRANLTKYQKEHYIKEQMSVLKKELDVIDGGDSSDSQKYEKLLKKTKLSKDAKERVTEEIKRLAGLSSYSSEISIVKTYLDTVFALPWNGGNKIDVNLKKAREILDGDHYGMEKVKERILEYIGVQSRLKNPKGAILCLYGPPGVGKTSLVQSIAKAMGRGYAKIALGGMRDEAEIRGHRKTYIGAFPGRIIQAIKRAGTSNPVILLDEIDKISDSYKGDPAAALLEVLDPEQNKVFYDNYLEFGYDLSEVMFIATANSLNSVSYPLLDRMDTIKLSGYTESEKLHIARDYLFPKSLELSGLVADEISISDDAYLDIIRYYVRESGVRSLEREVSKTARKVLKRILESESDKDAKSPDEKKISITSENLKDYLGIRRYDFSHKNTSNMVGISTGLAYTDAGGDILMIEAVKVGEGKGEIKSTGKLGEVMKESMQTALSYIQSHSDALGVHLPDILKSTIHVHVPEGATPKDGPSAGIAIATALVSLFSGVPVNREVAMTGEITLRGQVLPIGGLKEKLMSAVRSDIKTVIVPKENEKDLEEIPDEIKSALTIVLVSDVEEVLKVALAKN